MQLPRVLILYTGGTFGMDIDSRSQSTSIILEVPKLSAPMLKKRFQKLVPELSRVAQCDVELLLNRDSSHIGPDEWILFAKTIQNHWKKYDGIVLLHGTDTLSYTASALSFLLRPCLKPVIITGAQRPLTALRTDARTNLISAVEIAVAGPRTLVNQVSVLFGDQLYQGNRVRKRSSTDFSAFHSPHAPAMATVGTTIRYAFPSRRLLRTSRVQLSHEFSKKVLMVHVTPGFAAEPMVEALLPSLEGIVLVIFQSLTAPTHDPSFLQLLKEAKIRQIPIALTTESSSQPPNSDETVPSYPAGRALLSQGVFWAGTMTPECTFIKTALILGQMGPMKDIKKFAKLWKEDFAGEGI
jgi:L-asparaginase